MFLEENSLILRINRTEFSLSLLTRPLVIKSFIYPFDNRESNTTSGQRTERDCKAVSQVTHIAVGVNAARDDVKLLIKRRSDAVTWDKTRVAPSKIWTHRSPFLCPTATVVITTEILSGKPN